MTTGRPWTQIAPKDPASTNIELIDGDVTLVIDLCAARVLYTDPGWPDYPTPRPLYEITNVR